MDRATLINFKKAMDGDWKKERRQTRQQQLRPVVWILLLAVLFCGLVIIIAVSFKLSYAMLKVIIVNKFRQFYSLYWHYLVIAVSTCKTLYLSGTMTM